MEKKGNNIKRKEKNSSDKFSTLWINGVKFKLEDINTRYLIKQINLLTVVSIGGLLGGVVFLISAIISLIKNDISIFTLFSVIVPPLCLLSFFINNKKIKFMKNELKKREMSDEEKAFIRKSLKRTVTMYIVIGIAIVGSMLVFTGLLLESTDIDSNSHGKDTYEMPDENDDSVADYIKDQDPDLYNDIVDRYDSAVQDYNNSNNKNSGGSSYGSSSDKQYGAGGYEMPNENDKSFSDYVQRVDPDLYNDIVNNYNDAVGY